MHEPLVTLQCPACRKENQCEVGATESACSRCGCDLAVLSRIRWLAHVQRQRAVTLLQSQEWKEALQEASDSWELEHHPASAQCALVASAALGLWEDWTFWLSRGSTQGVSK